jgi:excisionase family DNA binding protein
MHNGKTHYEKNSSSKKWSSDYEIVGLRRRRDISVQANRQMGRWKAPRLDEMRRMRGAARHGSASSKQFLPGHNDARIVVFFGGAERPTQGDGGAAMLNHASLPLLLTPGEAGELLRTSRKAIYSMVERGQLPGIVRVGRRVLIRSSELLDFLDHNCASSPQENRR